MYFEFDSNGNLALEHDVDPSAGRTYYDYDPRNLLTRVDFPGAIATNYFYYNGLSERTRKDDSTGGKKYTWDGLIPIVEKDLANATTQRMLKGYTPVEGIGDFLLQDVAGTVIYPHKNQVGTTMRHTSAAEAVVNTYEYDAWGQPFVATETNSQAYRYTSKELDPDFVAFNSENRRYHFPYRAYVGYRGHFVQVDPLNLLSHAITRYGVSGHNPARFVDPAGLLDCESKPMLKNQTVRGEMLTGWGGPDDDYEEPVIEHKDSPKGKGERRDVPTHKGERECPGKSPKGAPPGTGNRPWGGAGRAGGRIGVIFEIIKWVEIYGAGLTADAMRKAQKIADKYCAGLDCRDGFECEGVVDSLRYTQNAGITNEPSMEAKHRGANQRSVWLDHTFEVVCRCSGRTWGQYFSDFLSGYRGATPYIGWKPPAPPPPPPPAPPPPPPIPPPIPPLYGPPSPPPIFGPSPGPRSRLTRPNYPEGF